MENKFDGSLAVDKKPKKENPMSRIVVENFSDWKSFRNAIKDAWENINYDPRENKLTQNSFIRGILGSYADKIDSADFEKLSNLIIEEINVLERREEKAKLKSQEKEKTVKEKYVQRDMPFGDGEKSIGFKSRDKNLSKNTDKILYH